MSDAPNGLIHAKLLDGEGGARDLDWSEVASWQPERDCLWLHFDYEEAEASRWLTSESGLNDVAVRGLLSNETRPRAISRGDNLLLTLRGVNLNPGQQPDDMVSVRIWTDGQRIISTRRRTLQSTEDLLKDLEDGHGPKTAVELLVSWTDRLVERMGGTVDNFEERVAEAEQQVLSGDIEKLRFDIAQLRKQAIIIRRYLAPQREALSRLYTEQIGWIDEMDRLRLREINDRLIRHIEDIDAVRERAAMTKEELLTQVSEEMNRRSYVFTVVATIFLPLGFFTGLMGINVGGMPGVNEETAFWIVVALCLALTVGLGVLFRMNRWL